jgi:copper(I)-binding protein
VPTTTRRAPARRRVAALGCSLALTIPALAACGFNAQTDKVYQPAVGVNQRASEVAVLGGLVVSRTPGSGVFIASLVNKNVDASDTLESIQADGGVDVAIGGTTKIPANGLVNLADQAQGYGIPVTGKKVSAVDSDFVTFKLTFAKADPVTINVPVIAADGPYADLDKGSSTPTAANNVATQGSQGAFPAPTPAG